MLSHNENMRTHGIAVIPVRRLIGPVNLDEYTFNINQMRNVVLLFFVYGERQANYRKYKAIGKYEEAFEYGGAVP